MKIKEIKLLGFRRFDDLSISDLSQDVRMVVMTGPNGCGKSSLFDAFSMWYSFRRDLGMLDATYHNKVGFTIPWNESVNIVFHGETPVDIAERKKLFYVRSAYRNEADFSSSGVSSISSVLDDTKHVKRLIENDIHVSDNYKRLIASSMMAFYNSANDGRTAKELREELIGQVRVSMQRVFDDLLLTGIGDPFADGTFTFQKGARKDFLYKNLSGGEKATFDILLDFILKRESYNNTVFCIDEPETHLNTRVQGRLLAELFELLPENCQLWVSTHSIGMMTKAKQLQQKNPGQVSFLDFDNRNFDEPCTISPTSPDRAFWGNALKVALDDLAQLVAPAHVVLCEGKPLGSQNSKRSEFDASCYRKIFASEFPDTDFISVGNASDVQTDRLEAGKTIQTLMSGTKITRVVDCDDRSPEEVKQLQSQGIGVLSLRHIEAYLFDDEILSALCQKMKKPDRVQDVLTAKKEAMAKSIARNNPSDDVKSASREIYVEIKRLLDIRQGGSAYEVFCRDTLADLVTSNTQTYQVLKRDVFGV